MSDIEKIKVDILRDALKDASDTTRALDRKINFLVSYNAIFLGVISTLFFSSKDISFIENIGLFYLLLIGLGLLWVGAFIYMMIGISPRSNPIEVFKTTQDKELFNNVFFVFTNAKKASLELDALITNYSLVDNYEQIEKLLYKEIGKVSYIRDMKLKNVSTTVRSSWILTVLFIFLIGIFGIDSLPSKGIDKNKPIDFCDRQANESKSIDDNSSTLRVVKEDINVSK